MNLWSVYLQCDALNARWRYGSPTPFASSRRIRDTRNPRLILVACSNSRCIWRPSKVMLPAGIRDVEESNVPNMHGTWTKGLAQSRYFIGAHEGRHVNGVIQTAEWSGEIGDAPDQFYHLDKNATVVESLSCSGTENVSHADVFLGDGENDSQYKWGTVSECETGPSLVSSLRKAYPLKTMTPPTIILNSTEGDIYLIVEESSSYPPFLYSVWAPSSDSANDGSGTSSTGDGEDVDSVHLRHVFHIASTVRLAEAVVTGIVHSSQNCTGACGDDGQLRSTALSGGRCFALLRQFSEYNSAYSSNLERASPFGEHPTGGASTVTKLSQVENIEAGVKLSITAVVCAIWLMAVISIGFAWSLCLRSSIDMDIYNRDELIRALILDETKARGKTATGVIRMYVKKPCDGNIRIALTSGGDPTGTAPAADTECNNTLNGGEGSAEEGRTYLQAAMCMEPEGTVPIGDGSRARSTFRLMTSPTPSNPASRAGTPRHPSSPTNAIMPSPVTRTAGQGQRVQGSSDTGADVPGASDGGRGGDDDQHQPDSKNRSKGMRSRLSAMIAAIFRCDHARKGGNLGRSMESGDREALGVELRNRDGNEAVSPLPSGQTTPRVSEGPSPVPGQRSLLRRGLHPISAADILEQSDEEEAEECVASAEEPANRPGSGSGGRGGRQRADGGSETGEEIV